MTAWSKPLAILGVAAVTSVVAFHYAGGAQGSEVPAKALGSFNLGNGYELSDLELLETTLYHVEESYVEPGRVDYEKMYVAALETVERRVPVVMFRREPGGNLLHLEVGDFRTAFEVEPVTSRRSLQRELRKVAMVLEENLEPDDIPTEQTSESPYAQVEYALVNGVLSTLDPHSVLLPPKDSKDMDVDNEGEFGGLGITIVDRDGRLTIEYPLKDTPAERAGLQADDHIRRIDGESTINMTLDEAVSRLRGKAGTSVVLDIMRDGLDEPLKVTIVRDVIQINEVEGELLEGGIGYVVIKSFHGKVEQQLHDELSLLARATPGGLRGLVLDLRGNPGGYLNQAVAVADAFLESGVIVSTVDGANRTRDKEVAHAAGTQDRYPIAVLVNANSASASEIVAGALRNQERAVILGERTFGKGSVQNLHNFFDDSKLKLTISKYLTPGERSIQSVGIPADIELVPSVVEMRDDDDDAEEPTPFALLYYRERVRREADLDKHLERSTVRVDEPVYSVRYLRPFENRRRSGELELDDDYEVQFARDVLLATTSSRRSEILAAAGAIVSRHQRKGNEHIEEAFVDLDLDWRDGPTARDPSIDLRFDLGDDGVLVAGDREVIALEVTNTGDEPLYRLVAVAEFENEFLDVREFVFGRLAPGETRRWEQRVRLGEGYPTERTPVTFTFRDSGDDELLVRHAYVPVQGRALPRFSWSWTVSDVAPYGDGDGVPEVGEEVLVRLDVENTGQGPTGEAVARVKNESRKGLDILRGTVEPGYMVTEDGQRCEVLEAGVEAGTVIGDPATGTERIERGDEPRYAPGCHRTLVPGESWSGSFHIRINEGEEPLRQLELSLGDARAYDHAAIVRAGFYEYFLNTSTLDILVGDEITTSAVQRPPTIEVTLAPDIVVERDRATISGVVTDDSGVAHVMVYAGDDKVFCQGKRQGEAVRSVPFTADIRLEPGLNTVAILATDDDGYTDTSSVVTFYLAPEVQARLSDVDDEAPLPEEPGVE